LYKHTFYVNTVLLLLTGLLVQPQGTVRNRLPGLPGPNLEDVLPSVGRGRILFAQRLVIHHTH